MKKFLLIALLPALLFSESNPQGGNDRMLLKRSPGEAVVCGLLLPAGAALYNHKSRDFKIHLALQLIAPAALCAAGAKTGEAGYYYAAISLFSVSKLWDMYKGLHDAKAYNERLFFEKDFLRETE